VRHRWCELVIKHKYEPGYGDIERFLREDQAMGVYLYGELMVNEDAKQQELARKCFAAAQEHMDASSAKVVAEIPAAGAGMEVLKIDYERSTVTENARQTTHTRASLTLVGFSSFNLNISLHYNVVTHHDLLAGSAKKYSLEGPKEHFQKAAITEEKMHIGWIMQKP
ncbi:hypothetical protein EK904_011659, partial [Melospiza melodia maxima]